MSSSTSVIKTVGMATVDGPKPRNGGGSVSSSSSLNGVASNGVNSSTTTATTTTNGRSRTSSDASQLSDAFSQISSSLATHSEGLAVDAESESAECVVDEEEDLWAVWGELVHDWNNQMKKRPGYIKEMVRKGIPQHFRGICWQLLCNSQQGQLREKYAELLRQSSPCEKVIKRDIARTYPEHEFFRDPKGSGQGGLYNVMKAYSIHDSEVGYCQGSAFLVGLLLLQMPEEEAFAVFVRLMEDYRLREMYKPTMAELGLSMYQLECLVQELLPELHRHFEGQNYHTSMYASSWFLTLFTSCLPMHLVCRVIDLFLSEGMEIIFRTSVAILTMCKEDLLKLDMEGLLKYFQKEMPARCEVDPDYLVAQALQIKYDQKKMKKLTKEYGALKSKEQEEMVELRRLRTENRLLRARIENLEQESAELADKLIQGQVSRAQEAEDNFVIKRELSAAKKREDELKDELEKAYHSVGKLKELNKTIASIGSQEANLVIESLQEELIAVKLREAEAGDEMKSLRSRISDLEEVNHRLRDLPPDHAVAQLQEELIAVKLREAEANLSMKELRQKITDLQQMWEEHLTSSHPSSDSSQPNSLEVKASGTPSISSVTSSPLKMLGNAVKRSTDYTGELSRLKQELMSAKLREAEAVSELKELRQKVMELETQNQVSLNQIRRQAEDMNKVRDLQDQMNQKQRETYNQVLDEKRKYIDLDSRYKENQMMNRIKDLEQTQIIAELKQKVSHYDIKREESLATKKLIQSGSEPSDANELHDRMSELQSEMFRLEVQRHKLNHMTFCNGDLITPSAEYADTRTFMSSAAVASTAASNGSNGSNGSTAHDSNSAIG